MTPYLKDSFKAALDIMHSKHFGRTVTRNMDHKEWSQTLVMKYSRKKSMSYRISFQLLESIFLTQDKSTLSEYQYYSTATGQRNIWKYFREIGRTYSLIDIAGDK